MDNETVDTTPVEQDDAMKNTDYPEDLETEASKHLDLNKTTDKNEEEEDEKTSHEDSSSNAEVNTDSSLGKGKRGKNMDIYLTLQLLVLEKTNLREAY